MTAPVQPLVLVVDDYDDARELYVEFLDFSGFRVIQARDGAEALDVAFSQRPDVILMDLSLPVMDGWEATERLKADPRTSGTPIIILSGHAVSNSGDRKVPCDAFIVKPCAPDDVVTEVRRLLQQHPHAPETPGMSA